MTNKRIPIFRAEGERLAWQSAATASTRPLGSEATRSSGANCGASIAGVRHAGIVGVRHPALGP